MYTRWIRNFAFSLNPCNVASVSSFCVAPRIPQIPVHQYSVVKPLVPVRYAHNSEFDEPDEHFDLSRPGRDLLHPSTLVGARNILYSSCTDPVVEELRKCQKHEDVRCFNFPHFMNENDQIHSLSACQDLQRCLKDTYPATDCAGDTEYHGNRRKTTGSGVPGRFTCRFGQSQGPTLP